MRKTILLAWLLPCLFPLCSYSQDQSDNTTDKIANFPTRLFDQISGKTAGMQQRLVRQTEKYLRRMARQEQKLKARIYKQDSAKAAALYGTDPSQEYALLAQRLRQDSSRLFSSMGPEYLPYADSLQGALGFLNKNPAVLSANPALQAKMQRSLAGLQQLQAKLQYADLIKQFIQARKAQIQQTLSAYSHLPAGVKGPFQAYKTKAFYYAEQVRQYRQELNDPNKMMQTALLLLNKLPAFTQFMQKNSFLTGLFGVPPGYGTEQGLAGLQTREQVLSMIQSKIGSGGPNAASAIQQNLSKASQDIAKLHDKLSSLGGGSGDMDMPNFKPSDQHSKTFLKRLEYGFNLQTTRGSYYYPTFTDLGVSIGYKLAHSNSFGLGASFKAGWGSGWQHISLSGQGVGLRSWVNIHLKKSYSLTGGYELNYLQPFSAFKDIPKLTGWAQSGLIGIAKTISMKSTVFRKTSIALLWDFLSYSQVPQTQPVIFRIGYAFP